MTIVRGSFKIARKRPLHAGRQGIGHANVVFATFLGRLLADWSTDYDFHSGPLFSRLPPEESQSLEIMNKPTHLMALRTAFSAESSHAGRTSIAPQACLVDAVGVCGTRHGRREVLGDGIWIDCGLCTAIYDTLNMTPVWECRTAAPFTDAWIAPVAGNCDFGPGTTGRRSEIQHVLH